MKRRIYAAKYLTSLSTNIPARKCERVRNNITEWCVVRKLRGAIANALTWRRAMKAHGMAAKYISSVMAEAKAHEMINTRYDEPARARAGGGVWRIITIQEKFMRIIKRALWLLRMSLVIARNVFEGIRRGDLQNVCPSRYSIVTSHLSSSRSSNNYS